MRPKSIVTVVVLLPSTPETSSAPSAPVRISSVCSGLISLTDETMVVLPAPKPPAMRILSATGMRERAPSRSERTEAIHNRLEYVDVMRLGGRGGLVERDEARRA